MRLALSISGADKTVILPITITKGLSGVNSTASFNIKNENLGTVIAPLAEVIISNSDTGDYLFRGFVTGTTATQMSGSLQVIAVSCTGLEYLLNNVTVNMSWTNATDSDIIQDAFAAALPEISMSGVNMLAGGLTFDAKDISLRQMLDNLIALTNGEYRVTENKVLSYRRAGSVVAAFGFSDTPNHH